MENQEKKKETTFKAKDVRLLRERLAWCFKKSPPQIQQQIHQTLIQFAANVSEYCQCEEKAFVAPENKYACLNCGKRHNSPEGDPKLDLVQ